MKVIPLTEAKARLSHYGRMCRKEPVNITVNGAPAFQLVPLDEEDDLVEQLLEHNAAFGAMLKSRLREKAISSADAARRL